MTADPLLYIGCGCVVVDRTSDDGQGIGVPRYLLVRETKAVARGRLALPAGSLEPEESLEEAAVREVREETGLVVEPLGLLGVFHCAMTSEWSFGVNFVFEARPIGGELVTTDEHPEVVWLSEEAIVARAVDGEIRGSHVVEAVRRSRAGIVVPPEMVMEVFASP